MSLRHVYGLLYRPKAEWGAIRENRYGVAQSFGAHTVVFALIPAVAGYFGTPGPAGRWVRARRFA